MTHPSFLAFDTTGFWVGKFEVGYDGATTKAEAQSNTTNVDKVIIKPNVYSWRNVKLGFAFQTSYEYLRSDESHMMKNTEWGAVAYLHHSTYGSQTSLRVNNNSLAITGYAATEEPTKGYATSSTTGNRYANATMGSDGTYTVNYLNSASVVASTTGNITGIYDMSGGSHEYISGYTTGASTKGGSSGITEIYSDFLTNTAWEKYYDKYSTSAQNKFDNRILGDATGELGPFQGKKDVDSNTRNVSSWYGDIATPNYNAYPWLIRGWAYDGGTKAGAFGFHRADGAVNNKYGYRIVLAPDNLNVTTKIKQVLVNGTTASIANNSEYNYISRLSNTTTTATINVETLNPDAKVVIIDQDGTSTLSVGNNLYTIKVTSANGQITKEYVLNVYRRPDAIIANSVLENGTITMLSKTASYGPSSDGTVKIDGTSIKLSISDYYEASRRLVAKFLFEDVSFIGVGQTLSITNTFKNSQLSSGNNHEYNSANLYVYNLDNESKTLLGSIKKDGTKEFTAPTDGGNYTFYLEISAWAGLTYSTQNITVSISELLS